MVFNYCIYGDIDKDVGTLQCTYIKYDMNEKVSKTIDITENNYQFNLGDDDFLTSDTMIFKNDIIILTYFDENDNKIFSDFVNIDINDNKVEFNIDTSNSFSETSDEANFTLTESIIKTSSNKLVETSESLYNYYKIINSNTNELIVESNLNHIEFSPSISDKFKITQYAVNKTNTDITSKEFEFNAIVSSATITRSSKCKSLNDSIKILFLGYDDNTPTIDIFKENDKIESGDMATSGDNIYSYNFVFDDEGYFLFKVNYNDEVFILSFRVNSSYYKAYHIQETVTGEELGYKLYKVPNVDDVIEEENLTYLEDGLYTTEHLGLEYGDYLFVIDDDDFVVSFEECANIQVDDNSGYVGNSQQSEEIFWIFPNNVGA